MTDLREGKPMIFIPVLRIVGPVTYPLPASYVRVERIEEVGDCPICIEAAEAAGGNSA